MNCILKFPAALWFIFLFTAAPVSADPVAEAYQAIPHQQTTYSAGRSSLDKKTAATIERLLSLSDSALIERIEASAFLTSAGRRGRNFADYELRIEKIRSDIAAVETPAALGPARKLILEAIEHQRIFLAAEYTKAAGSTGGYTWPAGFRSDRHVQQAHQKLLQAYQILDSAYAQETEHNKKAFYDHLCALDFL